MKLSYRGQAYEPHHQNVETSQGEIAGHYRGLPWRAHHHKQQSRQQADQALTYRGITYNR
ncbi:MAG: DUF4278 domain-containing protein [Spirulinaceae cyanobacterium]